MTTYEITALLLAGLWICLMVHLYREAPKKDTETSKTDNLERKYTMSDMIQLAKEQRMSTAKELAGVAKDLRHKGGTLDEFIHALESLIDNALLDEYITEMEKYFNQDQ